MNKIRSFDVPRFKPFPCPIAEPSYASDDLLEPSIHIYLGAVNALGLLYPLYSANESLHLATLPTILQQFALSVPWSFFTQAYVGYKAGYFMYQMDKINSID